MTAAHRFQDSARYWRTPLLPGADLLTAEYHDHEFTPHWHDAYTIPVIVAGAEGYRYRGSDYVAEAGSVPIINPGELHTGSKAVEAGWRYRVMYAPVDFIQQLANELRGKPQALPWFAPGVIRDPDLAQRLAHAHRLLEAADDPLAAETAMLDALSTLLVRYSQTQPEPSRLADRRRARRDHAGTADRRSRSSPLRLPKSRGQRDCRRFTRRAFLPRPPACRRTRGAIRCACSARLRRCAPASP